MEPDHEDRGHLGHSSRSRGIGALPSSSVSLWHEYCPFCLFWLSASLIISAFLMIRAVLWGFFIDIKRHQNLLIVQLLFINKN